MKLAWVEDGKIRDVAQGDPGAIYTPNIAAHYSARVPDDAKNGDAWDGKTLTKPKPVEVRVVEAAVEPEGYTLEFKADEKGLFALFSSQLEAARKA